MGLTASFNPRLRAQSNRNASLPVESCPDVRFSTRSAAIPYMETLVFLHFVTFKFTFYLVFCVHLNLIFLCFVTVLDFNLLAGTY